MSKTQAAPTAPKADEAKAPVKVEGPKIVDNTDAAPTPERTPDETVVEIGSVRQVNYQ